MRKPLSRAELRKYGWWFVGILAVWLVVWMLYGCTTTQRRQVVATTEIGYGMGRGELDSDRGATWGAEEQSWAVWVAVRPLAFLEPPQPVYVVREREALDYWDPVPPPAEEQPEAPDPEEEAAAEDAGWGALGALETAILGTGGAGVLVLGELFRRRRKRRKTVVVEDVTNGEGSGQA